MTEQTPDQIRAAQFRTVFRGYDTAEVTAYLARLAQATEELTEQRNRLATRLGEFADRDLKSEFEQVGREVTEVLNAARLAADEMRNRASTDATRWRAEATAEVDQLKKEARSDAEAMRTDAWTTGTQLLEQVRAETERIRAAAEQDALAILGEAERESHRLSSSARHEAEDMVRAARMESERLSAQARADYDDIISNAQRQAEAAQERTRALEERRAELMAELESIRSTLSSFEIELDAKRQGLGMAEAPPLPREVVIADERGGEPHVELWEEGHTVRVIRPQRPERPGEASEPAPPPDPEPLADHAEPDDESPDEPDEDLFKDFLAEGPAEPPDEREPDPAPPPLEAATEDEVPAEEAPADDDILRLFERLRQPEARPTVQMAEPEPPEAVRSPDTAPVPAASGEGEDDPFETRDRLLLPVTNTALRAVKRTLTDVQNEALDRLRATNGQWEPDAATLGAALQPDLESLVADAAEAGWEAATEMGFGTSHAGRPEPVDVKPIVGELSQALSSAVSGAGTGARERSAAASRVFRGWRTDEAERRVRWVAMTSYHAALRSALQANDLGWKWMAAGRPCPACREAAEEGASVPPAHRDCTCTIVPA